MQRDPCLVDVGLCSLHIHDYGYVVGGDRRSIVVDVEGSHFFRQLYFKVGRCHITPNAHWLVVFGLGLMMTNNAILETCLNHLQWAGKCGLRAHLQHPCRNGQWNFLVGQIGSEVFAGFKFDIGDFYLQPLNVGSGLFQYVSWSIQTKIVDVL